MAAKWSRTGLRTSSSIRGSVTERPGVHRNVEERRIRRAVGERGDRGVDRRDAELDRFETTKRAEAGVAVRVKLHRLVFRFAQDQRNQPARRFRREQSAGVFETNPRNIELGGFPRALDEILIGVLRRYRIDDVQNRFEPGALGGRYGVAPERRRIRRIRSAQLVDAVGGEAFKPKIGDRRRRDLECEHRAAADRTQGSMADAFS